MDQQRGPPERAFSAGEHWVKHVEVKLSEQLKRETGAEIVRARGG